MLAQPFMGFPGDSDSKEPAYNAGDLSSSTEWGRSPGEGDGNPLQYSCMGNLIDSGVWFLAPLSRIFQARIQGLLPFSPLEEHPDSGIKTSAPEFLTLVGRFFTKEMATHYSILAWKIPWTEKPGRLQSMGSQRVGHD